VLRALRGIGGGPAAVIGGDITDSEALAKSATVQVESGRIGLVIAVKVGSPTR
jgi:hypothetical protein